MRAAARATTCGGYGRVWPDDRQRTRRFCAAWTSPSTASDGLSTFRLDDRWPIPPSVVVGYGAPADHAFSGGLDLLIDVLGKL